MSNIITTIQYFLLSALKNEKIVAFVISALPIVEARLAIPIAFSYKLSIFECFIYPFLGSTLVAPFLLLFLIPLIRWLSKTKIFSKVGIALYDKFEDKSKSLNKKSKLSLFFAVMLFVAVPLPLTGVWTGCAVASIVKMRYFPSLLAITIGNLISSAIITILCATLPVYLIDYVVGIIGIVAVCVAILLIIKIVTFKKKPTNQGQNNEVIE